MKTILIATLLRYVYDYEVFLNTDTDQNPHLQELTFDAQVHLNPSTLFFSKRGLLKEPPTHRK